jgi:nitroreductase
MPDVGLYEAMSTLRAVRRLRPDPVPEAKIERVLQAAAWAPTGGNRQPWRVVVVTDAVRKKRLGERYAARWQAYATQHRSLLASMPEQARARDEKMLRAGDYLAGRFGESPVVLVVCFQPELLAVTDRELGRVSVVGGASIYTAVENLLLACRAEGLGCVLTTLLCADESHVKTLLSIPDPWATAAAVPVGYPLGRGHGPISRRPVEKLAFREVWGEPFVARGAPG